MPSRKLLERKSGSLELTEAIRAICSALEKKIRNLEKRKGKLETYKSEISEGKPLNEDQKIAVIKCDEVGLTLTFTNQLLKQLNQAADDVAKIVKHQVKYRNLERLQRDTVKVREILIVQDVLSGLGDETAREDFLAGKNGALKLAAENLENLDKLYKLITPCRDISDIDPSFEDQLTTASTHLAALVNSRDKDVLGTTYKELMDLILEIHKNDYFKVHFARESQEPVCTSTVNDSCDPIAEPIATAASPPPSIEPRDAPPVDYKTNVVPSVEPPVVPSVSDPPPIRTQPTTLKPTYPPPQADDRTVFSTFTQSKSCKEIIDDSPCSFNFLLDSQIELDASHIDPAVVAVHSKLPPSAVISYAGSQRPDIVHFLQPSIDESIGKITASATNSSIHPKANQFLQPSQITQHVPAANFSQTIPSQTFMNQTFVNLQTFTAALYGQLQQQPKQPQLGEVQHHHEHQQVASTSIPVVAVDVTQEPKKHLMNVNATTFESLSFKQSSPLQLQPVQSPVSVSGMQLMEEIKNISIDASNKQRTASSPQFSESPAEDNVENESDRYKESNQYGSYEGRSNYHNSNNGNGRGLSRGGRPSRAYSNGYMGRGGRSSNNNYNYTNGGRNYHNNYRDYYQNSYSRDNYEGTSSNSNYNNGNNYRRREGGSSGSGNGSLRGNPRGGINGRGGGGGANGGNNRGNFRSAFTKSSEPSL